MSILTRLFVAIWGIALVATVPMLYWAVLHVSPVGELIGLWIVAVALAILACVDLLYGAHSPQSSNSVASALLVLSLSFGLTLMFLLFALEAPARTFAMFFH